MLQEFNNEAELLLCDVAINYDDTPIDSGKFCILLLIGSYFIMLCDICWPICDVIAVVCLFLLFLCKNMSCCITWFLSMYFFMVAFQLDDLQP